MKPGKTVPMLQSELQDGKLSYADLSRKYGVCPATVTRYAQRLGLKRKYPGSKSQAVPSARNKKILKSCAKHGKAETARRYNLSRGRIYKIVERWMGTEFEAA